MDHFNAERWVLEEHRSMIQTAERRSRLRPYASLPVRPWMARRLRSLADRVDTAPARSVRLL